MCLAVVSVDVLRLQNTIHADFNNPKQLQRVHFKKTIVQCKKYRATAYLYFAYIRSILGFYRIELVKPDILHCLFQLGIQVIDGFLSGFFGLHHF
jgi:hypothetical protein